MVININILSNIFKLHLMHLSRYKVQTMQNTYTVTTCKWGWKMVQFSAWTWPEHILLFAQKLHWNIFCPIFSLCFFPRILEIFFPQTLLGILSFYWLTVCLNNFSCKFHKLHYIKSSDWGMLYSYDVNKTLIGGSLQLCNKRWFIMWGQTTTHSFSFW